MFGDRRSLEKARRIRVAPDRRRAWWRTARGYLLLPHFVPVLVVELATTGFAIIAWGGVPPAGLLARLLLAMLGGQLAIGAINEIVDFPDDTVGKPGKPLPSGDVSMRGAKIVVMAGLAMMVAFGISFGPASFGLLVFGTGIGIAYDLWLKRTPWSWLPYLVALPLLPIWVFVTLGRTEPTLLLLYPLGALATLGVHFAQALPDVAIDREAGFASATSRLGSGRTFAFAWLATLSAPLLAWVAAGWLELAGSVDVIPAAAGFAILSLMLNIALVVVDRRVAYRVCFPLVALSALASAFAWTVAVAG